MRSWLLVSLCAACAAESDGAPSTGGGGDAGGVTCSEPLVRSCDAPGICREHHGSFDAPSLEQSCATEGGTPSSAPCAPGVLGTCRVASEPGKCVVEQYFPPVLLEKAKTRCAALGGELFLP